MKSTTNYNLILGAAACFAAGLLHFACLVAPAWWFQALGAGPVMAHMAARGHWYPYTAALAIGCALTLAAGYALSGAGLIRKLPFLRLVLCGVATVFLLRAVAFPWLEPYFPGNSLGFWRVTSGICFVIGAAYATGLWRMTLLQHGRNGE